MGHKKTSFIWEESLFNKFFNPNCVAPVSPSQQLEQKNAQSGFQSWESCEKVRQ
jgi:hypothetical protein